MTMDKEVKISPAPSAMPAPVKAASNKKPSFIKLLADFGSYLFNPKSDASSLHKDIVELESERARLKSAELESRKAKELALKKDKQAKLASEFHNIATLHEARIKHLEKATIKPVSTIITPPSQLAPKAPLERFKTPPVINNPAQAPAKAEQTPEIIVTAPIKTVSLAPSELSAKKQQDFTAKKNKAARNLLDERLKHTKQILKSKIENRAWNAHGLVQVNLIKEHRSMFFNWQSKMLSMIFFVVLTCLICVLAYGYLLILEKEKQSSNLYIFTNLDTINKQIAVVRKDLDATIVPFNDKLMYTGYMLDNHIYWTNFFSFLEQDTLADVYYGSGLDATINGNVTGNNGLFELTSIAKDYPTISNQTKVMAKSKTGKVIAVNISDADSLAKATSTPDQIGLLPRNISQAVKFKLKLTLDQKLFLKDK